MLKFMAFISLVLSLSFAAGCATTTMENVNKGAQESGKPVGQVLRVPGSFSQGVAEGIAGEPASNPYGR